MVLTAVLPRVSAPAPGGVGRSRRGRPAGRDPALAPVRAARSGCRRRRTARHPAPPGSRRPAGTAPGPKRVRRPGRGLPRPRRRCPSWPGPPPRPRVTAAPAIAVRTPTTPGREPHRNRHHARGRTRRPQSARSPGNPRARHSTREHVCQSDVLAGQVTISRTAAPDAAAPRASRCAFHPRERRLDHRGPTAHEWSKENAAMNPPNNLPGPREPGLG